MKYEIEDFQEQGAPALRYLLNRIIAASHSSGPHLRRHPCAVPAAGRGRPFEKGKCILDEGGYNYD